MKRLTSDYDVTEIRFLVERAGLEDAQAMARIVYAVLSSHTRRIVLSEAERECRLIPILMPSEYRRAARQLTGIRLLTKRSARVYEAAVDDMKLCEAVRLLRCRLSAGKHSPGFPSVWGGLTGVSDYELGRCGPNRGWPVLAIWMRGYRRQMRSLYRDGIAVLDTLLTRNPDTPVYFGPHNHAAEHLADSGHLRSDGKGTYRIDSHERAEQVRAAFEQFRAHLEKG